MRPTWLLLHFLAMLGAVQQLLPALGSLLCTEVRTARTNLGLGALP